MWLTGTSLERIDSALDKGPTAEVDRLLEDILAGPSSTEPTPTVCAVCRRDLTRSGLRHSAVTIYTCPAGHGSWLDSTGVGTLQKLLQERATAPAPAAPRRRLAVLIALLSVSLAGLVGSIVLTPAPYRAAVAPPMSADERRYFDELMSALDEGIMNRRNIDGLLKGETRPDIYISSFEAYRARQEQFLQRLDAVTVPARLRPIHERIRSAAQRQIGFYRDFKDARVGNPAALPNLLGHPDLRASDYDLHTAWDLIRQNYPALDPRLSEAIESRLCNLDAI